MTETALFDDEALKLAEQHPTLGVSYAEARKIAERFMASWEAEHLKPLIDKAAENFRDQLWSDIVAWLLADTESNLQGEIRRTVDNIVKGILSGETWAVNKYALGERYDCEAIRKTLAGLISQELQDKRVADLEEENKRLAADLKFYRERRY